MAPQNDGFSDVFFAVFDDAARVTVGFRKSVAVKVINEELIPDCYIDEKVVKKPNLAEIKASLKLGVSVKGCELEERTNINLK